MERIVSEVEGIYADESRRDAMSEAISEFAISDVDERIYAELSRLLRNKAKIQKR